MTYIQDAVSQEIINELIAEYNSISDYETNTMKKASALPTLEILKKVDNIDIDKILIAHFYKHTSPYYPHSDYQSAEKDNIVIPLEIIDGPNPYLIIFDQLWASQGITWTGNADISFKINKGVKGRPFDYDIINKTDQPISESLYKRFLQWQPKDFWYGLSGTPYELKPGNLLQFDSKQLHATSVMKCKEKLGLTIRYKS